MKMKLIAATLCTLLTTHAYCASNPASTTYVDNAINNYKNSVLNLKIGDFYQGGVVFYLDSTNQHGLTAAITDQTNLATSTFKWTETGSDVAFRTGAAATGVGGGALNTPIIVAVQAGVNPEAVNYAARRALIWEVLEDGLTQCDGELADPVPNCYGGWYLPAASELQVMIQNIEQVNATSISHGGSALVENQFYWSSSERGGAASVSTTAWAVNSSTGLARGFTKSVLYPVRAIRSF